MTINRDNHSSTIEIIENVRLSSEEQQRQKIESSLRDYDHKSSFLQLKNDHGWTKAIATEMRTYFPHYKLQKSGTVQIEERPSWIQCVLYGMQHVLAMFSGIIILPLVLGYDSNTTIFFSGLSTIIFFTVTGGRVPSYLGCSGSVASVILSATGFQYQNSSGGLNPNINLVQGALLILSLTYIFIAVIVMVCGYRWLEFLMPPVVTGCIITSIGAHLSFVAYGQISASSFDTYMAIATAGSVMFLSIYAPFNALRRIAILLGTLTGYGIQAICGLKNIGKPINFSEITSSPWIRTPIMYTKIEFHKQSISLIMPILVVLLAENLGHMKAIKSIVGRPMMKYVGRAYLGDAFGCLIASLGGTMPFTTYAENIGVLSVTQIFSPLVILFAGIFAMLLGFFAKFSAVVRSIPNGVLGGVTLILYALVAMTGVRIWVVNKIDFNDPRNLFIGGVPLILATVIQQPIILGNFQLDGIGIATFLSIILNQLLIGSDSIKNYLRLLKRS